MRATRGLVRQPSKVKLSLALTAVGTIFAMPAFGAPTTARHLVITEVAYDVLNEPTTGSAEYIEIFNPTDQPIVLNEGATPGSATGKGSFFISDSAKDTAIANRIGYWNVVKGKVGFGNSTAEAVYQFPLGATIPAYGTVVVCSDSDVFLNEFFAGKLSNFTGLPGSPQLFETKSDSDAVVDMLFASTYSGVGNPVYPLTLTNAGDTAILFYWDGKSDLVQDVDIAFWADATVGVNKTDVSIDGPDSDSTASTYKGDASQTTSLAAKAPTDAASLQRKNTEEPQETDANGNGLLGEDETSEYFGTIGSTTNPTWSNETYTPGYQLVRLDGAVTDALSFLPPMGVSAADGPNASGSPKDYGGDGTLAELYLGAVDTDANRQPDSFYMAVRGWLFGEPDTNNSNVSFVIFDLDPGAKTGVQVLGGSSSQLSDSSGNLDSKLSRAGFSVAESSLSPYIGFDGAVGMDVSSPTAAADAGWRTFGTAPGTTGTTGNFAWIGSYTDVRFQGDIGAAYLGAPGTTYAAQDGFEAVMAWSKLITKTPEFVFVVAVTSTEDGSAASPNTLPESTSDSLSALPQVIDKGVCFQVSTGRPIFYYVDADGDGYGSSQISAYCGPLTAGVALRAGDCNDNAAAALPGGTEVCDALDNDCDGQVDEGVQKTYYADLDEDTYGDAATSENGCTPSAGYVADATDCDDTDSMVNPGADEVCDDIDNDCSGAIDDGLTFYSLYADADADGFGTGSSSSDCQIPDGFATASGDCNDENAAINPDASEVCDNVDNDCDTLADDADGDVLGQNTYYADVDADGHGSYTSLTLTCAGLPPSGYVSSSDDCNDSSSVTFNGALETCDGQDNDCDGNLPPDEADADGDGSWVCAGDCNDEDSSVLPGLAELCDGKDNNCNSETDEGVLLTFYKDEDSDTFGGAVTTEGCTAPEGYVTNSADCDDTNAGISPAGTEICDELDNDCDLEIDEGVKLIFFLDADSDGYGSQTPLEACFAQDGYVLDSADCDDSSNLTYPGAEEICDAKDNNCDGQVPEQETDADQDGSPVCAGDCDDTDPTRAPNQEERCDNIDNNCDGQLGSDEVDSDADGTLLCAGDCDDSNPEIGPDALEVCDGGIDNDCTPATDETADQDGDGASRCEGDCNEDDDKIHPDALEICDGIDNDCNPATDETVDGDGDDLASCDGDCNDQDGAINPTALETCNAQDDNCNGEVDEGFVNDMDGDGVISPVCAGTDCNDSDDTVYPGADEVCGDGVDQNCDTEDDVCVIDDDQDGYPVESDCDDSNPAAYPGATEICGDSVDQDCNGQDPQCPEDVDDDGDGYSENQGDCNDTDAQLSPDAEDVCGDGIDQDCSGDDALCPDDVDDDKDGFTENEGDCDDEKASVNPDAEEVCGDGVDQDCSGADLVCGDDDDDTTPPGDDDDTTPPGDDDDTTPPTDEPGSCSCDLPARGGSIPAGSQLLALLALGAMLGRARKYRRG